MTTSSSKWLGAGFALGLASLVAACGTTPTERAASGAALGAAGGAAIGSVTGSAGKGAVIGAIAGGAAGALTDPCTLNLGSPYWKDKNASAEEYYRQCGHYPPR